MDVADSAKKSTNIPQFHRVTQNNGRNGFQTLGLYH